MRTSIQFHLLHVKTKVREGDGSGVAGARNADDLTCILVRAGCHDKRNRVGLGAHHAVVAPPSAMVGSDQDEPILVRKGRARRYGAENLSNPTVRVGDGGEVFGRVRIEAVVVACVVGPVDEPHHGIGSVGARQEIG